MDKKDSTDSDLEQSLRAGLKELASQNLPEDSATLRERRERRNTALSFGASLMLIAFNAQAGEDALRTVPDLFSLGAAALLVAGVVVRLVRSIGRKQPNTLTGVGYALMLSAAAILAAQAYGVL